MCLTVILSDILFYFNRIYCLILYIKDIHLFLISVSVIVQCILNSFAVITQAFDNLTHSRQKQQCNVIFAAKSSGNHFTQTE